MKLTLFLLLSVFYFNYNSFAQSNWSVDNALKISSNVISQIENSGYIIKAISVGNNTIANNINISSNLFDTIYLIAILTDECAIFSDHFCSTNDFALQVYSRSFMAKTQSTKDSLINEQNIFVTVDKNAKSNKFFIWKTFIKPISNKDFNFYYFKIQFSEKITQLDNMFIINQRGMLVGETPETIAKGKEYRQCILIAFSKS